MPQVVLMAEPDFLDFTLVGAFRRMADTVALALQGEIVPTYAQVQNLAKAIVAGSGGREILVCLQTDMAKALGHAIKLLQPETPCLCIDRVRLQNESFLDIGMPVGPALPVVIKTLILSQ